MSHNADQKFNVKRGLQSCKTTFKTPKICAMASKGQSSTLCGAQLHLPYEKRGQTDIFFGFVNVGEKCIAISNNREFCNKIHGPYIKPSGWKRNRIQQSIRISCKVLPLLTHAITLNELFHIGDHIWPPQTMIKSLECLTSAQVTRKVTAIKLSK